MSLLPPDPQAPSAWHDNLPVSSRYTVGLAGERFFRAIKDDGQIWGTRCDACQRTYVPAVLFCERCLAELQAWVNVGTQGPVHSFTLLYANPDGSRRETPQIVAFIRLGDGGLVHFLGEIEPDQVAIGLPVEAVFKPAAERQGSITDILHFKPV